jgi:transposase-like protein
MSSPRSPNAVEAAAIGGAVRPGCAENSSRRSKRWTGEDALREVGREKVESQGCPHCAGRQIVAWGHANGLPRHRCKDCGRTFRRSGLTRPPRKRGGKAKHPGLYFENIPVLVARDRYGATIDAVMPNDDSASIKAALDGVVTPANRLICDGGKAIVAFARKAKIRVHVVPAPGKPLPNAPNLHLNNVNAYHGRFKEWMRRFHGVATKNLPKYLGWRRALEAWGNR